MDKQELIKQLKEDIKWSEENKLIDGNIPTFYTPKQIKYLIGLLEQEQEKTKTHKGYNCWHCKDQGYLLGLETPCSYCNPGGEWRALPKH